jgi:hypothetical protein
MVIDADRSIQLQIVKQPDPDRKRREAELVLLKEKLDAQVSANSTLQRMNENLKQELAALQSTIQRFYTSSPPSQPTSTASSYSSTSSGTYGSLPSSTMHSSQPVAVRHQRNASQDMVQYTTPGSSPPPNSSSQMARTRSASVSASVSQSDTGGHTTLNLGELLDRMLYNCS